MLTPQETEKVRESVGTWIETFLSKPNAAFGGLPPCPFARKAWLDNKVRVVSLDTIEEIIAWVDSNFHSDDLDVACFVFDPATISSDDLHVTSIILEDKRPEMVFLDDHPEHVEQVAGVVLNHGTYAFIFAQKRDHLIRARKTLEGTRYYDQWTEEYKKEVVK